MVSSESQECVSFLSKHREIVVQGLIEGTSCRQESRFQDSPDQLARRVGDNLGLLIEHLRGREDFGALYLGQRIFELTRLERTPEENLQEYRRAVSEEHDVFRRVLSARVSPDALATFDHHYRHLTLGLVADSRRHVRTLFVGDCMLSEILSFVVGPLMGQGLSIEPFPINPRDRAQLRKILGSLATKSFDVIFFSPFSHARIPEVGALLDPARAFASNSEIDSLVDSVIEQTQALLEFLTKQFECPIFVHNAGLIPRATSRAKASALLLLAYRSRARAARRINRWLTDYATTSNSLTFPHIFVIDEVALARRFGRSSLGQYLSTSEFQHSVVLSQRLAADYRARLAVVGNLLDKKLVICDLDNTLWDGVIGEGPVTHFVQRQKSVKHLKNHAGVVLSIASKNDPASVRFDGGVLSMEDFVIPQISWCQKSASISKIKSTLNLQTRHMVFLDERAMVQDAFPDLLTLDSCDPDVWNQIALWGEIANGSSDLDRTRMYQEQVLRDAEIESVPGATASADSEILRKLALVVSIGEAKRADLKRVAELINRTNQWNLCGSRTSFEQVKEWHESDDVLVLVAGAADRFGDMGMVCVAITSQLPDRAEIPVFVLSCRVFGYGIESVMLGEIGRRCSIGSKRGSLIGHYRSTTQNHPCRNMYTDHGFKLVDGVFKWTGLPPLPAVPWAEVRLRS
jgi:FkbH-like protein